MKNIQLILLAVFLSVISTAQQYVGPNEIRVPQQSIKYKMNDQVQWITVSSYYIRKFPESIGEYKTYLNEKDSLGTRIDNLYPSLMNLRKVI